VGARFGGSLHGVENWTSPVDFVDELRTAGIERSFDCTPVNELVVTDGRSRRVVSTPRPMFYVVKRGDGPGAIERALLDQARALGARFHFGAAAPAANVDLVATGPAPGATLCIETGIRFSTRAPDVAVALVHPGAAPGGYAYLLVRAGIGCLSTVLFDRFREARRCLVEAERLIKRVVPFTIEDAEPTGGHGAFVVPGRFVDAGVARVGEAAGLQDALWGFGIRNSVACGVLAARARLANQDWGTEATRRFGREAEASVVNRLFWEYSANPAFSFFVSRLQRKTDPRSLLAASYRGSWVHRLLFPLARAHLLQRRRGAEAPSFPTPTRM
jgi:hypothetical protein